MFQVLNVGSEIDRDLLEQWLKQNGEVSGISQ